MTTRKLLITQELEDYLLNEIKKALPNWHIYNTTEASEWNEHIKDAEIIIGWKNQFNMDSIINNPNLRWVQTWSAGVNSLPLKELANKEIQITSANGVHSYPISETIFALMLALTRNIHYYVRNQAIKKWDDSTLKLEVHEKTIGIIGVGAIGQETAKIAKAFRMNVLGVRHSGKPADYVDKMYTPSQLDTVLPECDYVVVTLPLTDDTHHLFQEKHFKLMKPSAFFINIGRGEIVKETDLIKALQHNEILGAGLDVFEKEPLEENSPLWELDNCIITPHTSGSTEHYSKRVINDIFIPNIQAYLKQEKLPVNVVDYQKGY